MRSIRLDEWAALVWFFCLNLNGQTNFFSDKTKAIAASAYTRYFGNRDTTSNGSDRFSNDDSCTKTTNRLTEETLALGMPPGPSTAAFLVRHCQ